MTDNAIWADALDHAITSSVGAMAKADDKDRSMRAGDVEWDCRDVVQATGGVLSAVVRNAEPTTLSWHPYGLAGPADSAAMGIIEILVHTDDLSRGLGFSWEPPAELCAHVMERLFVDAPTGNEPWPTLLWATGRIALGERQRQQTWRWKNAGGWIFGRWLCSSACGRHNSVMDELSVRPMTEAEFDEFRSRTLREYADEHVRAGNWTVGEAETRAISESDSLLPQGVDTPGVLLLMAENADGAAIGHVWVALERRPGSDLGAWIYDIEIKPGHRGKGYGRALLRAAEQETVRLGIHSIGLNVFGTNKAARALYESTGYQVTSMQMNKELFPSDQ